MKGFRSVECFAHAPAAVWKGLRFSSFHQVAPLVFTVYGLSSSACLIPLVLINTCFKLLVNKTEHRYECVIKRWKNGLCLIVVFVCRLYKISDGIFFFLPFLKYNKTRLQFPCFAQSTNKVTRKKRIAMLFILLDYSQTLFWTVSNRNYFLSTNPHRITTQKGLINISNVFLG